MGRWKFAKSEAHPKRDASSLKCIPLKPQMHQPKDQEKDNDASHPYVPLPGLWLSVGRLRCRWLLQSVANGFSRGLAADTVADRSQTVATCCKTRKTADSVSRRLGPVPFLDEGAIGYRWTRIRRTAEKQVRTWSTCAPSFLSCPPRTRGRSPRLGTKSRRGWQGE